MTSNPGGISQSNTGSMAGGQQAAIGNDNPQTMTTQATADAGEQITQQEVIQLLAQMEQMIRVAELPQETKEEATMYLGAAKKATEKEEPHKERIKTNLEAMAEALEKTSKTVESGKSLWQNVLPLLGKVAGWLGPIAATANFFLPTL